MTSGFGLDDLVDELSRVFNKSSEAQEVALRAGFPVSDLPAWETANLFWGRLVRAADDGKTLGGVQAIIEQARAKFPRNRIFAACGSKTVIAPVQPGPLFGNAVGHDTRPHGAASHEPRAMVPVGSPASSKDATSMNTNHASYPPNTYAPLPNQIGHAGHGASGRINAKIDARVKNDNRKGIGAVGITAIVLVMGAGLCTMGWLAFDAIKSMPRNSDGSVTVWGVFTVPESVVGEPPPEQDGGEEKEVVPNPTASPPDNPPPPAVTTRKEIEGVWDCRRDGWGTIYTITFTEAGRAAFSHASSRHFEETPLAKWTDQPYTIVSAKTIEVGGMLVQVEVSADGQTLRAVGGNRVLDCEKKAL